MSWPISSSSGTSVASWSREMAAYLLVMQIPTHVHLDRVVDVVLVAPGRSALFRLLTLCRYALDRAVQFWSPAGSRRSE
jgi:radical SAM superfamily enzyme with C-terminal helix-hairpin-helix motif